MLNIYLFIYLFIYLLFVYHGLLLFIYVYLFIHCLFTYLSVNLFIYVCLITTKNLQFLNHLLAEMFPCLSQCHLPCMPFCLAECTQIWTLLAKLNILGCIKQPLIWIYIYACMVLIISMDFAIKLHILLPVPLSNTYTEFSTHKLS